MKTSIAHNNNVSLSKGILISAYIHNSAAYVLLDGNRGYILRAENQEEEERIAAFVDQLQIGAYVFAYLTYNGRIMKLFDMLSWIAKTRTADRMKRKPFPDGSSSRPRSFCARSMRFIRWVLSPTMNCAVMHIWSM